MNEMEQLIIELVVNGGNARSKALEAIEAAKNGESDIADSLMKECNQTLGEAHKKQTDIIQAEARGEHTPVTLLMVHAQDHLMNAMTVRDLAKAIIEIYKGGKAL